MSVPLSRVAFRRDVMAPVLLNCGRAPPMVIPAAMIVTGPCLSMGGFRHEDRLRKRALAYHLVGWTGRPATSGRAAGGHAAPPQLCRTAYPLP